MEIVSSELKKNNTQPDTLVIARDIRIRLEFEKQKNHIQKIESLGLLAGGIAHDFNNILMVLLGTVNLLESEINSQGPIYSYIKDIEKGIHQAKTLTDQLLMFTKSGNPKRKIIDIKNIIQESVKFSLLGSNCISDVKIDPELRAINTDAGQLHQVLNNLIINAVQAMTNGGVIIVEASNVFIEKDSIKQLPQGDYVQITIQDQGPGISPDVYDKIFIPYTTSKKNGKGLGLATCYSIVKKHEVWIGFTSELNKGTKFTIIFPAFESSSIESGIEAQMQNNHPLASNVPSISRKPRILIVEDEEKIRYILTTMLLAQNYDVVALHDGTEAIALFKVAILLSPFQIAIMDVTIRGGMSGLECFSQLKSIDPALKGIVMTGYSETSLSESYQKFGFSAFLQKPFELDQLIQILQKIYRFNINMNLM